MNAFKQVSLNTPLAANWPAKQVALPQTHSIGWAVAVSDWSEYSNKQNNVLIAP